jgi:HlyD family secretion protein
MPRNLEESDIRSEEVQDILGRVPSWITRNGIAVVYSVMIILILGSWLFKYPDFVTAPIVVTSENPPAKLLARVDGKISEIFVVDKQKVEANQLLARLESPVNYQDLCALKAELRKLDPFMRDFDINNRITFRENYALGEMQTLYTDFLKKYADYLSFTERNYYAKKIQSLRDQVRMSRIYFDRQQEQKKIMEAEIEVPKNKFLRDSSLYKKGIISLEDYERSKGAFLTQQSQLQAMRTTLAETQLRINEADQAVIDKVNQSEQELKAYQLQLTESHHNLLAAIDVWELNYLLRTPISGELTLSKFWSKNQNVARGEMVFTIIPGKESKLLGKVQLNRIRSGKVKPGQRVNIKFDNYPYMEYGMVEGKVNRISKVPTNDYYALEVDLPNGLVSTYGKIFEFNNEIQGTAEIVTEDLRLIQRIFNPIKSIFKERVELGKKPITSL